MSDALIRSEHGDISLTADDTELIEAARRARRARITLARAAAAAINEFVLRDEELGTPIENAPVHIDMHRTLDAHRRVVLWSHIESGKTSSITIGRTLFELGKNPSLRVAIVSNTANQAVKVVRTIATYIAESRELHQVFPHLKPALPWTSNHITVDRPNIGAKDHTVTATGVHGAVLGARFDLLILDDILDYEITRTEQQRDELLKWYRSTLAGRVTANGRIWAVGTAWDRADLYHVLSRTRGFVHRRFAVQHPATGEPTWPARWPLARCIEKRDELGEIEAKRQLDCIAPTATTERFKAEWIQACLDAGRGYKLMSTLRGVDLPEGAFAVTGVDLGFTKNRPGGAKTVFFTVLFYPDGVRQLLWIEAGHFSGPEIVLKAIDHFQRFGANVYVETNAAQRLVLDFATNPEFAAIFQAALGSSVDPGLVPVLPFQTGTNKWHPTFGIESLGVELSHVKWLIPNGDYDFKEQTGDADPEVIAWLNDMRNYSPTAHSGDYLMASWFAREGGRGYFGRGVKVTARVIGAAPKPAAPAVSETEDAETMLAEIAAAEIATKVREITTRKIPE